MRHVGRLLGLSISVCLVLALAAPVLATGPVRGPAKCEIAWTAPTTNTDGSALSDLKSYDVYISPTKGQFTTPFSNLTVANPAPGPNTTVTYDCRNIGLTDGQKWFTVRAVDLSGNASANGQPDPTAVADGATQADGVPFVFDGKAPGAGTGLKISP